MKQNLPSKLIVHHTAVSGPGLQFPGVNNYHREKWNFRSTLGFYCGYHYFIEKNGTVIQARDIWEEGAHTIGQNLQSVGICLAGNFDIEEPTRSQNSQLASLLMRLCDDLNISPSQVFPHRRFAVKSCYGVRLSDDYARGILEDYMRGRLAILVAELKALIEKLSFAILNTHGKENSAANFGGVCGSPDDCRPRR